MSTTRISETLRRIVIARAAGCCEYCLTPSKFALIPHQVDHVVAEKHGGATIAENLALACVVCNQLKGSDIASIDPETGQISPLFNPRRDSWRAHFAIRGALIVPLTPAGRATTQLLQLNAPKHLIERKRFAEDGHPIQPRR